MCGRRPCQGCRTGWRDCRGRCVVWSCSDGFLGRGRCKGRSDVGLLGCHGLLLLLLELLLQFQDLLLQLWEGWMGGQMDGERMNNIL